MKLEEALETLDREMNEGRRYAWRDLKQRMEKYGARLRKHGPFGVRVLDQSFAGLKKSIEQAGGRFRLKKIDGRDVGMIRYDGHDFNIVRDPKGMTDGELIVVSDGTL